MDHAVNPRRLKPAFSRFTTWNADVQADTREEKGQWGPLYHAQNEQD